MVIFTPDLNHSNKMIQFIIEKAVVEYKQQSEHDISHMHIWSDGCGSQLKNRWQLYWLMEGLGNIKLPHNVFQSCHGKAPSDSEGAVVKSFLRRQAFLYKKRINDSKAAYELCNDAENGIRKSHHEGVHNRHSIITRKFYFVELSEVDHLSPPCVRSIKGFKAMFCFAGKTGCACEL